MLMSPSKKAARSLPVVSTPIEAADATYTPGETRQFHDHASDRFAHVQACIFSVAYFHPVVTRTWVAGACGSRVANRRYCPYPPLPMMNSEHLHAVPHLLHQRRLEQPP